MKKLILLASFILCSAAFADAPMYRPVGTYSYNKEVLLTKKRTAETVGHTTTEGQKRMADLKKLGFICVRKNQQLSICQKTETNLETPVAIQTKVDDYLATATFVFPGTADPILTFDGANTEWMVNETVQIGSHSVALYKIVKVFNGGWYAVLPVSDEQGIANLEIINNDELKLPLTLEGKVDGQTVAYFITATFVNK